MDTFDILLSDEELNTLLEQQQPATDRETIIKMSYGIQKLRRQLEAVKKDRQAAMSLYAERIARIEEAIERLSSMILPALERTGKVVLPNGRSIYAQRRKEIIIEADEMELARRYDCVRIREEVDRSKLRKLILDGQIADGVRIQEKLTVVIR